MRRRPYNPYREIGTDWTSVFITIFWILVGAVVIGAFVFGIASCINTPNTGNVFDKQYYPSYTSIDYDCVSYSKNGSCSLRLPRSTYHSETFYLCIENKIQDKKGCKPVNAGEYNNYKIGQWYP